LADGLLSSKTDLTEISGGDYLLANGHDATVASGSGQDLKVESDEAEAGQGSLTAASATGSAEAYSSLTGAGRIASGSVDYSYALGLAASGKRSAVAAAGDGSNVFVKSDEDIGIAHVESGTLTGVTSYDDAWVSTQFLGSGDILGLKASAGIDLQATGVKSASGTSGAGDEVVLLSNEEKGKAKVENGGIFGMAAHDGASVDADFMGSIDLGIASGWIGLGSTASGQSTAMSTGSGSEVTVEADEGKVEADVGSLIGITAYGQGAVTSATSMSGYEILGVSNLGAEYVLAQGDSASAAAGSGDQVIVKSDSSSASVESTVGFVDGLTAFGKAKVSADSMNVEVITPSSTNLYAEGDKVLAASAAGGYVKMQSAAGANRAEVTLGSMTGLAAEGGYVSAGGMSEDGTTSGTKLLASGTESSAASATGLSTVIESNKIAVGTGSAVGMVSKDGQVRADSLGFSSGYPSGSVLEASGKESTIGSSSGGIITMKSNDISTIAGSLVGASASNSNGGAMVSGTSLSTGLSSASGTYLKAENADNAIIAAVAGSAADLNPTSAGMTTGSLVGVGAVSLGATGDLHADSLTASYTGSSSASGSGLLSKAGTSAILGAAGTLTFKPSATNGIDSGGLFAEAGGKTTTSGNSLSSTSGLQSSYTITGALTANRNVAGSITASGTSESKFVFAGYTGDRTNKYRSNSGTYSVSSYYNTVSAIPPVSKGASIS